MSTVIKHKEFTKFKSWTMDLCGRPLTIEVGKVAELASASAMVKYGDTTVLGGRHRLPPSPGRHRLLPPVRGVRGEAVRRGPHPRLLHAPGGPPLSARRAGQPPHRPAHAPLFPYDFRNDVCIQCTDMSVDYDCSPEVAAMIGASACVSYSEIPFAAHRLPGGGLLRRADRPEPQPGAAQDQPHGRHRGATREKVVMIEAGADEIPDEIMYAGIVKATRRSASRSTSSTRSSGRSASPRWSMSTPSSTRSCSTRSWTSSWTRPRPPWTPTTRTSGSSAGTP